MPFLRMWVHCPRASNGLLPRRSNLVGYVRWDAQSDRFPPCQTIIPTAFRSQSGLPVIHLESPKWQGESHPLAREGLGYAVEFAPFARDINELSRGTAVGTNLPMKNSAQHTVVRSAFPTVDDHRRFVLLKAAVNYVSDVAAVRAEGQVNPIGIVQILLRTVDHDPALRTLSSPL